MSGTIIFNKAISLPSSNSYTMSNVYIMTSGNIGINITSPSNSLDLSGTLRVSSGGLSASFNTNTVGSIFTSGGNIGLNTTAPSYHMDVNGNLRINQMSSSGLTIGDPALTSYTDLSVRTSSGVIEMGIAPFIGAYSAFAAVGDAIIRSSATKPLILQSGFGGTSVYINTNGNVGIGTGSQNTRISITPSATEPKITLWDGGSATNHYGFGISPSQINYHVDNTAANHVFSATGKNGDGTELIRFTGTGLIQSNNFKVIQVFALSQTSWGGGTNSSNFTVGSGTKMLYTSYCYYAGSVTGVSVYFDIYTSTGTLVTTLTTYLFINVTGCHMPATYTTIITDATMPAGTYYIRARTDGTTNIDDYLYGVLVNFPF